MAKAGTVSKRASRSPSRKRVTAKSKAQLKGSSYQPKTYEEWRKYEMDRQDIISRNRSLRLRGKPLLPQPPKAEPPVKRVVYSRERDGGLTFEGVLREGEEVPPGMILRLEKY